MGHGDEREQRKRRGALFPPGLVPVLSELLPDHPVLEAFGHGAMAEVLTAVFFASLETEEHEHHPIRVLLVREAQVMQEPAYGALGFQLLPFRAEMSCSTRHLLRLARALGSDRLAITITGSPERFAITGLAREGFGKDEGELIEVRAPEPGCLEVRLRGRRLIEYVRGKIQVPPEDVLLSAGRVRDRLLAFAAEVRAPSGYIDAVASAVRHLAEHPHGGILVLSATDDPEISDEASFVLQSDTHLWDVLHELHHELEHGATADEEATSGELRRQAMRAEIERTIHEIGRMTALDGATILDRRLGVRGFGIVLPVRADLAVIEVLDAAARERRAFLLDQYGARHRAAASYAASHPGSLVFVASATGDIGCMLADEHPPNVLLWRFRSGDLASPVP
jgi:hypothetical protein